MQIGRAARPAHLSVANNFYLISADLPLFTFLPLQGGGKEGEGVVDEFTPIPTPTLPVKGREFCQRKMSASQVTSREKTMFGFGMPQLVVILAIILVVFGASRLPEIGGAMGKSIRNFKKATEGKEIEVKPEES